MADRRGKRASVPSSDGSPESAGTAAHAAVKDDTPGGARSGRKEKAPKGSGASLAARVAAIKRPSSSRRGSTPRSAPDTSGGTGSGSSSDPARSGSSTGAAAAGSTTASRSTRTPAPAATRAVSRPVATPRTRTARLRLVHVDPWSVMKMAFLLSIAIGIIMIVAVAIIWGVLGAAGVWDSINSSVQTTVGSDSSEPFNITDYIGAGRVIGFTMVAAVIDVVVLTALATLGAFIYNLAATLLGGVETTLAEDR